MIVCLCRGVSDRSVRTVIAAGARTIGDVGDACGAGSDCRICCAMLAELIQEAREAVYSDPNALQYLPAGRA